VKFKNIASTVINGQVIGQPLSFDCGGTHYDVPVGGVVDIPDRFAYAIVSMGVMVEPFLDEAALEEAIKPDPRPESKPNVKK
jgi:hypothetical protein